LLNNQHAGGGTKPPPANLLRRWLVLLLSVLLIVGFAVIVPKVEQLPVVGSSIKTLRESGIDVGAWFYDDVDEVAEAADFMRRALGPGSREQK